MTIKSDIWLRKMAEDEGMITPFLSELVREVDGKRIISAGCSSYGYDMRLADDGFRIFSSVHAKEIDPKKFDDHYSLIEPELHDTVRVVVVVLATCAGADTARRAVDAACGGAG